MTALDVTLTPAQWEHLDRHGWTLTAAPTEPSTDPTSAMLRAEHAHGRSLSSIARACGITRERVRQLATATAPVPATVPCPECNGSGQARIGDLMAYLPPCRHCDGSGVVPRTVGMVRPEVVTLDPKSPLYPLGSLPAGRVGTATVTPVPVVDVGDAPPDVPHVVVSGVTGTVWWCGGKRVESGRGSTVWTDVQQVQVLFATPPNPGTTVWRLDKENDHE